MKQESITLRGYREGDLDAMYALDVECFELPFRFTRAVMKRYAEARRARVVIADCDGEMIGFGIVHIERDGSERVGYVVTLDVAIQHRRRGVAQMLLAEAERLCVADGCAAITLHVFVGNEVARRFYERCGFVRAGETANFYGRGLDAEVWSKSLAS